jgi:predicted permease
MIFSDVYQSDFSLAFQPRLVALAVALVSATWAVGAVVCTLVVHDPKRRGTIIQGACRTNYVLFGIPVATSLFGPEHVGVTAILIAFIVPLFNVYSVIALELNRGGHVSVGRILLNIIKNPLIDASLLAFLFVGCSWDIPSVFMTAINDVADVAMPLALIVLGGTFQFSHVGKNRRALVGVTVAKLLLLPAAFVGAGIAAGYTGVELGTLLAMNASPTAVSSFAMADQMGGDGELAAQIIVVTTAASVFTLFLWVFVLASAGLLAI